MNSPLPWIKLHTQLVHHLQLPSVSMAERGVFFYLLLLGGLSSNRGVVLGEDAEIARIIHATRALVTKTIDLLSEQPFEMLKRVKGGVEIVNWDLYQMPRDQMSHQQRAASPKDGSNHG